MHEESDVSAAPHCCTGPGKRWSAFNRQQAEQLALRDAFYI
jgi:hypothetical protein